MTGFELFLLRHIIVAPAGQLDEPLTLQSQLENSCKKAMIHVPIGIFPTFEATKAQDGDEEGIDLIAETEI